MAIVGETDLAPNQHGAEDDLQTIKEVVSNDDDCSAPCGPTLTGTDGFNAGRCSWKKRVFKTSREKKLSLVLLSEMTG